MKEKIILLNGSSSSGKSTLASTLQTIIKDKLDEEYAIISIDHFLQMTTNDIIYEDDVFEISSKLCDKSIEMLCLQKGVIIDHVITSERIFKQLIERLESYNIYLVHVTCPLHELKRREEERKNRCSGSAEASYKYLFPKEGYDLVVDTFLLSAKECSLQILENII
ncbi:phosphotransferase-like protein [Anaerosporobacter sp.]|uniref:phosphotransferase-like protein n=1 Tax=Anaerosporobacter sp. TaxID=1872529 RepID=UPI00286EFD9A|nr:AAA family ATPase [Anaerosporobacter sp.]